jgi:hypothetical protein
MSVSRGRRASRTITFEVNSVFTVVADSLDKDYSGRCTTGALGVGLSVASSRVNDIR